MDSFIEWLANFAILMALALAVFAFGSMLYALFKSINEYLKEYQTRKLFILWTSILGGLCALVFLGILAFKEPCRVYTTENSLSMNNCSVVNTDPRGMRFNSVSFFGPVVN